MAEYDVYFAPQSADSFYLLRFANRAPDQPLMRAVDGQPSGVRIKHETGHLEFDIPMRTDQDYDRRQGVIWGESMRRVKVLGQVSYGASAGFQRKQQVPRDKMSEIVPVDEVTIQRHLNNFDEACAKGHVLNSLAFGGQIRKAGSASTRYMLGAFNGRTSTRLVHSCFATS